MQPKPRQVEWAVDQAVTGVLDVQRAANWKNLGMPAYRPQTMFPSIPLSRGRRGARADHARHPRPGVQPLAGHGYVVPGVTGNPLIGNYYGIDSRRRPGDDWDIDWAEADCGYGVAQVTDGMRMAGHEHAR